MRKLVIVISGRPGAGSSTISRLIAKKLKLKYFSTGLVHKGISKTKKESLAALQAWNTKYGSSKRFHKNLDKLQVKVAKKGNVVITGKLAIHFLKKYSKYKIWLDVPLKVRARRTAHRDKIPYRKALKEVAEREKIERKNWKKMYGIDYFALGKDADFIIDTSKLKIGQSVHRILKFIRGR